MKFSEVIGQQEAKESLLEMVKENRVPHALMLCGPQGCGKMALALAFASYLLGESDEKGQSILDNKRAVVNAGAMLKEWGHPDLHFTFPVIRAKGMSSEHKVVSGDFIKEWRGMLQEGPYFTIDRWLECMNAENQQAKIFEAESDEINRVLSLKSSQGGYKISLIWLPERMNVACANKLLKILEEPPMQTVFIMVCQTPELLLQTIKSRTQRIDVKRVGTESIRDALVARRGLEEDVACQIARTSDGSWLKALQTLDAENESTSFLDMFIKLMRMAYTRDVRGLKFWSDDVARYGREKQRRMIEYFERMIRENFVYNFHQPELNYLTAAEEKFSKNFARFVNERNVVQISELLEKARRDIGQNANAKIVFFHFSLQLIVLMIRN